MLKQFKIAAAVVTAAVASTAFASAASANPIDSFTVNSAGNTYQFGNSCAPGAAPAANASLNWRNNPAGTSGAPLLAGTLCLQNTTDETRVKVTYHDAAANPITRFITPSLTGTGGPLDTAVHRPGRLADRVPDPGPRAHRRRAPRPGRKLGCGGVLDPVPLAGPQPVRAARAHGPLGRVGTGRLGVSSEHS